MEQERVWCWQDSVVQMEVIGLLREQKRDLMGWPLGENRRADGVGEQGVGGMESQGVRVGVETVVDVVD